MRLFFIFISYFYIHVINVNLSDCYNHAVLSGMVTALLCVIQFPPLQHECECIIFFLGHAGKIQDGWCLSFYMFDSNSHGCIRNSESSESSREQILDMGSTLLLLSIACIYGFLLHLMDKCKYHMSGVLSITRDNRSSKHYTFAESIRARLVSGVPVLSSSVTQCITVGPIH